MTRVVITGIGLITGLGIGTDSTWRSLVEGRSAVGPIRGYDASSLQSRLGAEILDFAPDSFVTDRRTLRMMTRGDQLAYAAACMALEDAGYAPAGVPGDGTALFLGGGKEVCDLDHLAPALEAARRPDGSADIRAFGEASSEVYPLFYVEGLPGSAVFYLSKGFGLTGPGAYYAGTAEAGVVAIGTAFRAIKRGEAEIALAGASDDAVSPWSLGKLDGMGLLTDRNELGPAACRPFERARSGTVVGEGAAILVLEALERAQERGAHIVAEVVGFGSAIDADGLTPDPHGTAVAAAIRGAWRESGSGSSEPGGYFAHGSGTVLGDLSEAQGLHQVFSSSTADVAVTSVKPATGHLVAAAGALNVALAALALDRECIPPTLNLDEPDPACDLDVVSGAARSARLDSALAAGRGQQGQCSVIELRRGLDDGDEVRARHGA